MDQTVSRPVAVAPDSAHPDATPHPREGGATPSFDTLDRLGRATTARFTQGISPHAVSNAWFDWASHLAEAPGRLTELWLEGAKAGAKLARFALGGAAREEPVPFPPQLGDHRFADPAWAQLPYVLWEQAFLAQEAWWQSATREVRGMTPKNAARVAFMARQLLDVWSPCERSLAQSRDHRAHDQGIGRQSPARRHQLPG